jgi:type IV pilus assembly protein PilM
MDVESFATLTSYELIQKQLPGEGANQIVAIVDIGATMMHINVLRNGQQVYFREQAFGGNQLTQDIQRRYNLSAEEAEAAKRSGGLPENYEPEVLQPFMTAWLWKCHARCSFSILRRSSTKSTIYCWRVVVAVLTAWMRWLPIVRRLVR